MKFSTVFTILASLAIGADACSTYRDCKCHDKRTGLQDDKITQATCNSLSAHLKTYTTGVVNYNAVPNHSCQAGATWGIDNCDWDARCKLSGGQTYYQYCYNKW